MAMMPAKKIPGPLKSAADSNGPSHQAQDGLYTRKVPLAKSSFTIWLYQVESLLRVHFLSVFRASLFELFLYLLIPTLFIYLLPLRDGTASFLMDLKPAKFRSEDGLPCKDNNYYCQPLIMYSPNTGHASKIMHRFSINSKMSLKDVIGFKSVDEMLAYQKKYFLMTDLYRNSYLLSFNDAEAKGETAYSMVHTQAESNHESNRQNILVHFYLEQAISEVNAGSHMKLQTIFSYFPSYYDLSKINSSDTLKAAFGSTSKLTEILVAFYLLASGLSIHFLLTSMLMFYRDAGVLRRLRQFNLFDSAYWFSIFLLAHIFSAVAILPAVIYALIFKDNVVKQLTETSVFLGYFCYMISAVAQGAIFISLGASRQMIWFFRFFTIIVSMVIGLRAVLKDELEGSVTSILSWLFPGLQMQLLVFSTGPLKQYTMKNSKPFLLVLSFGLMVPICFFIAYISTLIKSGIACGSSSKKVSTSNSKDTPAYVTHKKSVIVSAIDKNFGKIKALQKVSLTFDSGIITALLGHNGSGKSTLIDIISGVSRPTEGFGTVFGHSFGSFEAKRALGICPQRDALYPLLSASEHIYLYSRFRGFSRRHISAYSEKLLSAVGLSKSTIGDKISSKYSGGMRRRLTIISALVGYPEVVVFDEPTRNLDPINRRQVWEFIKKNQNRYYYNSDFAQQRRG